MTKHHLHRHGIIAHGGGHKRPRGNSTISGAVKKHFTPSSNRSSTARLRMGHATAKQSKLKYKISYKRRSFRNDGNIEPVHGEIKRQYTKLIVGHEASSRIKKGSWKIIQQYNVPLNVSLSTEGYQGVNWIQSIATTQQLITNNAAADPRYQLTDCLFGANPYQKNTGGALYSSGVTPTDDRIVLNKIKYNLEFTNGTTGATEFDVYILLCKKNQNNGPADCWQQALNNKNLGKGVANQGPGAVVPGVATVGFLGERPETCQAFNKLWKVMDHKRYDLAPNATVVSQYIMHYKKQLDLQYVKQVSDSGNLYLANVSIAVLTIQRGQIVVDYGTGGFPAVHTPAIAPTQIAMLSSVEYQCYVGSAQRIQTEYVEPPVFISGNTDNLKQVSVVDTIISLTKE